MEICKVPTLRLKVPTKHSIAHIMYNEMEMLSAIKNYYIIILIRNKEKANTQFRQGFKRNYAKDAHTHTHTHTHARKHARTHIHM